MPQPYCNKCETLIKEGDQYKCLMCYDFDLCGNCMRYCGIIGQHDPALCIMLRVRGPDEPGPQAEAGPITEGELITTLVLCDAITFLGLNYEGIGATMGVSETEARAQVDTFLLRGSTMLNDMRKAYGHSPYVLFSKEEPSEPLPTVSHTPLEVGLLLPPSSLSCIDGDDFRVARDMLALANVTIDDARGPQTLERLIPEVTIAVQMVQQLAAGRTTHQLGRLILEATATLMHSRSARGFAPMRKLLKSMWAGGHRGGGKRIKEQPSVGEVVHVTDQLVQLLRDHRSSLQARREAQLTKARARWHEPAAGAQVDSVPGPEQQPQSLTQQQPQLLRKEDTESPRDVAPPPGRIPFELRPCHRKILTTKAEVNDIHRETVCLIGAMLTTKVTPMASTLARLKATPPVSRPFSLLPSSSSASSASSSSSSTSSHGTTFDEAVLITRRSLSD